jgi:erythromycin esterase-like protein
MVRLARWARGREAEPGSELMDWLKGRTNPLRGPADLDRLMERVGDARFVLLGEASHGTSGFYTWRTEITRRLVEEKGFSFVAVEGDWPACDRVDGYVKGRDGAGDDPREVLRAFDRWPTWMWANEEVVDLAEWLRAFNRGRPEGRKVGFHGLDVYSLWDSLYAVLGYLRRSDPSALDAARRAFRCFEPYGEDAQEYARATALVPASCQDEVVRLLATTRQAALAARAAGGDGDAFRAEQNALVVKSAEAYYRAMVRGGPGSWNVRDRHMSETLDRLARHYGPGSRAVVWEHNTHVGDARFTDMAEDGMVNVGQLARERHAADGVVIVGFSTRRGGVIAGRAWNAPMQAMTVPDARPGSWDDLLSRSSGRRDALLLLDNPPESALEPRGQRAIGVVYHPEYEDPDNYVPTVLPRRYDAVLFLDDTNPLRPLPVRAEDEREVPETFPAGT